MPELRITGTMCALQYPTEPDQEVYNELTALKRKYWAHIGADIDKHVEDQLLGKIMDWYDAPEDRARTIVQKHLSAPSRKIIHEEFNRGLVVICNTPDVVIRNKSCRRHVNMDTFGAAIRRCYAEHLNMDRKRVSGRVVRAVEWADAVIFSVLEQIERRLASASI